MKRNYFRAIQNTLLLIPVMQMLAVTLMGQPISRYKADSLLNRLTKTDAKVERQNILIKLAQFHIFKPGENPVDLDSAAACINEARQLNEVTKSLTLSGQLSLTESYLLRERGHQELAILKLKDAINIFESCNDQFYLGKTFYELSGYYDWHTDDGLKNKLSLVEQSVIAFDQSNGLLEKADALTMLGDLYNIKRDESKAIEALHRALAAYDSIHYKLLQGVYVLLGKIYSDKNDFRNALYYQLLALKTAESCQDSTMQLCHINSELASLYLRSAKYEEALFQYKEALKTAIKYDDRYAIAMTVWNISRCYTLLNRPNESLQFISALPSRFLHPSESVEQAYFAMSYMSTYLAIQQYKNSADYLDVLLKLADEKKVIDGIRNIIYRLVANYYLQVKDFTKARFYLSRNIPITKSMRFANARAADERLWYKLDSSEGNYQQAFYHLHNYKTISDSLFDETKSRQFQQLEVEYETSKKEDSLQQKNQYISLLIQKNNLQQTNLKQLNLIKNITIIGIVFILLVLILLYHQFRNNQKNNHIILHKNEQLKEMLAEKEWWLKEVHHRVKNNLHTIICLLESQAMYLERDALHAIEKSQHRIYAMSLIHQKLYQNEDIRFIDMNIYLEEFIGYLRDSFDTQEIDFIINVEPVQLNLQQAIPVALIINEGVTNSIKYAFKDQIDAVINISMSETDGNVILTIMDNGQGFEMKAEDEGKSLGIQLIKGLSKELKGTVSFNTSQGTKLNVVFKKGPLTDQMTYVKNDNIEQ